MAYMQTGDEKKGKKCYGAHQHFIDATRKNRLTAFGICTDPHDLDITKFIPPGKMVISKNTGDDRALTISKKKETQMVAKDMTETSLVSLKDQEQHLVTQEKKSKKVTKQKKK